MCILELIRNMLLVKCFSIMHFLQWQHKGHWQRKIPLSPLIIILLLFYSLLNDYFCSSEYVCSGGGLLMICKVSGRTRSWPDLWLPSGICREGLQQTRKSLRQYNRSLGENLHQSSSDFAAEVSVTRL